MNRAFPAQEGRDLTELGASISLFEDAELIRCGKSPARCVFRHLRIGDYPGMRHY